MFLWISVCVLSISFITLEIIRSKNNSVSVFDIFMVNMLGGPRSNSNVNVNPNLLHHRLQPIKPFAPPPPPPPPLSHEEEKLFKIV